MRPLLSVNPDLRASQTSDEKKGEKRGIAGKQILQGGGEKTGSSPAWITESAAASIQEGGEGENSGALKDVDKISLRPSCIGRAVGGRYCKSEKRGTGRTHLLRGGNSACNKRERAQSPGMCEEPSETRGS